MSIVSHPQGNTNGSVLSGEKEDVVVSVKVGIAGGMHKIVHIIIITTM